MHTKSRLVGERCDRKLGRVHGCAGWVAADLAFCRHVLVRAAGFRGACGTDEENGPGTREICGVLLLEVSGRGDRDWLADVSFLALVGSFGQERRRSQRNRVEYLSSGKKTSFDIVSDGHGHLRVERSES